MSGSSAPRQLLRWGWFFLAAPIGLFLGARLGQSWLVAGLPVLLMYPVYWQSLRDSRPFVIYFQALLWAISLSVSILSWVQIDPDSASRLILRGSSYFQEMLQWVRTGQGEEASPRLFLPVHASHFLIFGLVSLLSAGFLGLLLGSLLVGYMSFYVGALAALSTHPGLMSLAAWHPWAILRVLGFIACGVALSLPLRHRRLDAWDRRLMLLGLLLIGLDIFLKTFVAESWRQVLLSFL